MRFACARRAVLASLSLTSVAFAQDVVVDIPNTADFIINDSATPFERFRVDTASGNLWINSEVFIRTLGGLFIGPQSGSSVTTGSLNAAIGSGALSSNTTGNNGVAIGAEALFSNTIGSSNVGIGLNALRFNTSGGENTAIGREAGINSTTGSNNIYLGSRVYGVAGESDTMYLGGSQTRAFISGVRGVDLGAADALPVVINPQGQLGTGTISGTAVDFNYAGSNSQGGPASNALLFDGKTPSAFVYQGGAATLASLLVNGNLDAPRMFTGTLSVSGTGTYNGRQQLNAGLTVVGPVSFLNGGNDQALFGIRGNFTSGITVGGSASFQGASFTGTVTAAAANVSNLTATNVTASSVAVSGNVNASGRGTFSSVSITGGGDIAEPFDVTGSLEVEPGMLVSIDQDRPGGLRIADTEYDSAVAGVISGAGNVNAGLILKQENSIADGAWPVALTGRVYAWVDADVGGAVRPGDLLTTSAVPGHAMRADPTRAAGSVLGKAMSSLQTGRGLVLVLVSLQ